MSSMVKGRANSIVVGDQWLLFLAASNISTEVPEKVAHKLSTVPDTDDEDAWYENHFRHCLYLVATDRFAQICDKAGIKVPDEEHIRKMVFNKKLWNGCSTEEEAIERLQTLAKRFHW